MSLHPRTTTAKSGRSASIARRSASDHANAAPGVSAIRGAVGGAPAPDGGRGAVVPAGTAAAHDAASAPAEATVRKSRRFIELMEHS